MSQNRSTCSTDRLPSGASRRDFIRAAGCAALGAPLAANVLASTTAAGTIAGASSKRSDYKAMVCIFLYGGNDSNNLIIPTDTRYSNYASSRGSLALPKGSLLPIAPSNVSGSYGLHPSAGKLQKLFGDGKLAVLANVGTLNKPMDRRGYERGSGVPADLFDHAAQQLQWQAADANGRGWGGRCADLVASRSQRQSMPISLAGENAFQTGGAPLLHVTSGGAITRKVPYVQNLGSAKQSRRFAAPVQTVSTQSGAATDQIEAALGKTREDGAFAPWTWSTPFPSDTLGNQLKTIARLIQARTALGSDRQIFFASLGGFDLHAAQIAGNDATTGPHANLLNELSEGMFAFQNAMEQIGMGDDVVTFTLSEFGRSLHSNGDGSEHGWGSHQLIMGGRGCINGQSIYGTFPTLDLNGPDNTGTGALIPSTSVEQYAATLARWYGVDESELGQVFPTLANFKAADLGFMRSSNLSTNFFRV